MHRAFRIFLVTGLCSVAPAWGQSGPTLPATCATNDTFTFTGVVPSLYLLCGATNTWVLQSPPTGADTTTGNVSTTAHGLAPKLPGGTTTFLRADGAYAAPPGLPSGFIGMVISGTCPTGTTEVAALDGKTLFGTVAASANVGTTGGADTITPAGTNSAPSFSGSSATTSSDTAGTPAGSIAWPVGVPTNATEAAHTHPGSTITWPAGVPTFAGTSSTVIVNHVHVQSVNSAATGGLSGYTADTSTNTSATSGYSTANPTGGSASYTPAGTIAWPAGVPTNGATGAGSAHGHTITWPAGVPTFAGSALAGHTHTLTATGTVAAPTFTGTSFDNRSAFVRVIFCQAN